MVDTIIAEMKNVKTLRKRRAVSPVIATVIIVAVTITVAVAVSYWMSGIASQYTSFEKVELKSAYASRKYDADDTTFMGWIIEIGVQNTGSSTATLESLFVNEKPMSEYGTSEVTPNGKIRWTNVAPEQADLWSDWDAVENALSVSLESGDEENIYILIYGGYDPGDDLYIPPSEGLFSAGTTINVKLQSASGMDYIKLVKLT